MIVTLGLRNLIHDRIRFAVTLIGVIFATVLVTVQLGLYLSSERMIATLIDRTTADLWIVPRETRSLENGTVLPGYERYLALSTPGVIAAAEMIVGFAEWRKPSGGKMPVFLVGSNLGKNATVAWDIVEGSLGAMEMGDAVAVDRRYMGELGVHGLGDEAEIAERRARIAAVTQDIRSFTTLPYVFGSLATARHYLGIEPHHSTYVLVHVAAGNDFAQVRAALLPKLRQAEVLTAAEFRARTIAHWLFATGAGAALVAGAALGILVGGVIVGQSLYASASEHLAEFATLRALGSTARYIHCVILVQAVSCAIIGYGLGTIVSLIIVWISSDSAMPVIMTPLLALVIFALSLLMCVAGGTSAILKVLRIDPTSVFNR